MSQAEQAGGEGWDRDRDLYAAIRRTARVVVRSIIGDRPNRDTIIEDIGQVTAVEVFQLEKAGRVSGPLDRNKLICTVARNRCIDWLRRDARENPSARITPTPFDFDESNFPTFTDSIAAMTKTPSSLLGWREIGSFAIEAISRLPDSQRGPVVMYLFGGMKTTEIANTVGGERTAVANRVKRGLLTLRDELRRGFPDSGFDS